MCAVVLLSSCKEKMGISYSVSANGNADGVVDVTFPDGSFQSNGNAAISFKWDNDTTNVVSNANVMTLEQAYASKDKEIVKAAGEIESFVNEFNATSATGNYYIHLQGYVMETLTGLKVSIDKEFSNK